MPWEAWYTVVVIAMVVVSMAMLRINVDTAMVGGLALLIVGDAVLPGGDILPWEQGIAGYGHQAIVLIGALFVVAGGLQTTGGFDLIAQKLLGRPKSEAAAQLRMMVPVTIMSAFMNNTPIVAMYLPIVGDWAKKLQISASKLYMPLSFAAILGGKLTLIGTYSNIVVIALYANFHRDRVAQEQLLTSDAAAPWLTALGIDALSPTMTFWGVALLGVPTTILGLGVIVLLSRWLLPARRPASRRGPDSRRYQVEMMVTSDAAIVGRSIEEAGLRHLPGLYLTGLERDGVLIPAVDPNKELRAGDRLAFVGILESVVDLRKIRGLTPATDQVHKIDHGRETRTLAEAVISHNSPLVGQTVRAARFRTKYNAAIVAVHRNGEQIRRKIGDIDLRPGDTLLLDTHTGFMAAYRDSDDFYLVSQVEGSRPIRHERGGIALAILVLLVILMTMTPLHPVVVAFICAGLMVGTRCISGTEARGAVNWTVLLVIGAALGMGQAMTNTGAATAIAEAMLDLFGGVGPTTMLFILFWVTAIFAQFIGNGGAATLMFPIMMSMAMELSVDGSTGVSPEPFIFTLMIAAGSTFLSPVSYQTNLMVYGPGGYHFLDFTRLGFPLTLVVGATCTLLAPVFFPFVPG